MTYIVVTIAGIWVVGSIAFFAALGLAAKRPMPAPDQMEDFAPAGEHHYAENAAEAQSWISHPQSPAISGAVHSVA